MGCHVVGWQFLTACLPVARLSSTAEEIYRGCRGARGDSLAGGREYLRRCRQRAIELEEKKLARKRQIIQTMRRRAGRWSPRRSKNGRVEKAEEQAGRSVSGASAVGVGVAAVVPMSVRNRPAGITGGSGYSPAAAARALVSTNSSGRSIRRHRRKTSLLRYL